MRDDVPNNSDVFLMTNFINLKIKPTQSFIGDYRDKIYVWYIYSN
jgi:hypothetical protein